MIERLRGHIPASVLAELPEVISKFAINSPLRLSHFLAQCAHESGGFKLVRENLNYSAQGLLATFPKYFTPVTAKSFERKPEAIANRVYGGRMGNNTESDGWNFRGRGFIQLTGRQNYTRFSEFVPDNIVATPDLVATKYPLLSAAWFFHVNNLNLIADRGQTNDVIILVTRRVNGGVNGLSDRVKYFNLYFPLLNEPQQTTKKVA
jgi:putative chitinase